MVSLSLDDFYHLARTTLVKDEAQFDRFDLAFGTYFKGVTRSSTSAPSCPRNG